MGKLAVKGKLMDQYNKPLDWESICFVVVNKRE